MKGQTRLSSGQEERILVGIGRLGFLVVVKVEAGVVVFDGGKADVLEDAEGTAAKMLIGMLGDDEVEMDGHAAPEAATEPSSADTFDDLIEASNPPVTLPPTTKQIKIVKMMKDHLAIPNTRSCAAFSLPAPPVSVFAAGIGCCQLCICTSPGAIEGQ